jgi:galactokinase
MQDTAPSFGSEMARLGAEQQLFDSHSPVFVARAPGRLDVMGGIGDYSGSLVLQMPIAEAAFAAVQAAPDAAATAVSLDRDSNQAARMYGISPNGLKHLQRVGYDLVRQILGERGRDSWAAYVIGTVVVLLREKQISLPHGLRILIRSDVPEGKGVSSSAAVEVATIRAVAALLGVELAGEEIARLCQIAENRVVGAPCGIMDQMTAAVGRENELLALRCQPATVEGFAKIPAQIAFWGIDSGIRHAVSGSDYTSVRCGAFMGYRILADAVGLKASPSSDTNGRVVIDDTRWNGYLANVSPLELSKPLDSILPEQIAGEDFLKRYGGTTDHVTRVDPARVYAVRKPTLHPIEESASGPISRARRGGDSRAAPP